MNAKKQIAEIVVAWIAVVGLLLVVLKISGYI